MCLWRSRTYPAKANFKKLNRNNLKCSFLCNKIKTQEHIFWRVPPHSNAIKSAQRYNTNQNTWRLRRPSWYHRLFDRNLRHQKRYVKQVNINTLVTARISYLGDIHHQGPGFISVIADLATVLYLYVILSRMLVNKTKNPEKVQIKTWKSHSKSWESHWKFLRKYWQSPEKIVRSPRKILFSCDWRTINLGNVAMTISS